jgi:hypothetical protein
MKLTALTREAFRFAARVRGWWAASCLGLLLLPGLGQFAWAQGQPPPQTLPKMAMNKNPFWLPIKIEASTRSTLQEFQLYVKDDPSRPWALGDRQPPATTHFQFSPPHDGEYWFRVVTVDKYGRHLPADISRESPDVIVVYDSQPPLVDIRPLQPGPEGQRVQCQVRDLHPDPARTRLEYQTGDQVWRLGDPLPGQPDTFLIPAQANFTGKVRVTAGDCAGNVTVRELDLQATSTSLKVGQDRSPPAPFPLTAGNQVVASNFPPAGSPPQTAVREGPVSGGEGPAPTNQPGADVGPNLVDSQVQRTVSQAPAQGGVPAAPVPVQGPSPQAEHHGVQPSVPATPRNTGLPPTRKIINTTHVVLEYQIAEAGASGVGKVLVYLTADQGQSWQQLCEDADRRSPVEIDLPREGVFGIRLVASNGLGFGADRPAPGETPDLWVEVDKTRPFVELGSIAPGSGEDTAALWITWNARDKNLPDEPVDLYYAANREGPWKLIAKGIRNDGRYRWLAPPGMRLAYVRVTVTDKAGNSAHCETPTAVALDDGSRPVIRVTNITAPGAEPRAPSMN